MLKTKEEIGGVLLPNTVTTFETLSDLKKYIQADESLAAIRRFAKEKLGETNDPGHDISHCLRVAIFALRFAEGKCKVRNVVAAALLHDVINLPKNDPNSKNASQLSAQVTRDFLEPLEFSPEDIEDIACAVRDHSYSRGAQPVSLLGEVIQDADRIEALGMLGIFRSISIGTQLTATFFHPHDPWAENRELDDKKYSIDHFFVKLSKLPEQMNTDMAKRLAYERCASMVWMFEHLGEEIGHSWPYDPHQLYLSKS